MRFCHPNSFLQIVKFTQFRQIAMWSILTQLFEFWFDLELKIAFLDGL